MREEESSRWMVVRPPYSHTPEERALLQTISSDSTPSLFAALTQVYTDTELSGRVKAAIAEALWKRIVGKKDPISTTTHLLKCVSKVAETISLEIVAYLETTLGTKPPESLDHDFLWIDQVLGACIRFSLAENVCFLMQTPSFFHSAQKHLIVHPHKVAALLIRLMNSSLYYLIAKEPLTLLLKTSTGLLRLNIEVLLAHLEGYTLRKPFSEEELPEKLPSLPWDRRRMGHFPLHSTSLKSLVDSLVRQRGHTLALVGLSFLAESSVRVLQYLEDSGEIQRITKEAYISKGLARLRLEHFLISILMLKGRSATILAEEGYIESILKHLDTKLRLKVLDGEVVSSLTILRLLSRTQKIVPSHMSSYQMINMIERLTLVALDLYKDQNYPEIEQAIEEYLLLLGNLVLLLNEWKTIAINRILPHIHHYLNEKRFTVHALQFIKMILYGCAAETIPALFAVLPPAFFMGNVWNTEESIEHYGILKNLICKGGENPDITAIMEWSISEMVEKASFLEQKYLQNTLTPIDLKIASELLGVVSNVAVISNALASTPLSIDAAITIAKIDPSLTGMFIWYLTNTIWESPSVMPTHKHVHIYNMLLSRIGIDQDTDERIAQLIHGLRLTQPHASAAYILRHSMDEAT
ncbi:hypothetical protein NEDG_00404 [Nematocida displodere]|uniref:Uncharacterized protein n=1 Tax=Nematocida displodere TaxID=1805483 RepID=A0A177ELS1_9MICR|nr:hypothetical protein NEDG_00404 [Nematocida displodere]